jgi:glycosyltransferase involved in cell wall biosynthesis
VHIALVSGNPHLPQLFGGVETNTHELAQELIAQGHDVCVVAKLSPRDTFGLSRLAQSYLTGKSIHVDRDLGYPVYRSRRPWNQINQLPQIDVAVIQNASMIEFADNFNAVGVPSVAYFFGLKFEEWARYYTKPESLPFRGYIALSEFTARRFQDLYGVQAIVVPPILRRERYQTEVVGRDVTFINPVAVKGLELALKIVELCPDIPFGFVMGWPQAPRQFASLWARVARLRNVRLRNRTSDMRSIYRETRLLLVPSQWEAETWGRVASEAHFSGIPVIASNRGGLPEAVGAGGIVLGHNKPAEVWAEAVRGLWYDEALYGRLSQAALAYSHRPFLDPSAQTQALVSALRRVLK